MVHESIQIGLFVIFGIILLPVYAMIAGWFFGKPRDFRTVVLTLGYVFAFIAVLLAVLFTLGTIISFITPY